MLNQLKSQHSMALFVGLVAIVLLVVILSVQAPVAWATAPQDRVHQTAPPVSTPTSFSPVTCQVAGNCQTNAPVGQNVSVTIPPNGLPAGDSLVIQPPATGQSQPAPGGFALVGTEWVIQVVDANGNVVSPITFDPPLTICHDYTADMAAQAGGVNNLTISYYDTSTNKWVSLPTTVNASTSQVCTTVNHLTLFGLLAKTPSTLPVTGAALDNISIFAFLVVLIVAAMSAGFVLKSRVRA